ncbi:MAG: hypothetical protein GXY34_04005 [Syntrophomonadaceae bacterium]|nr:hypothetical protein [Syntrophomonadaceae bacterium]
MISRKRSLYANLLLAVFLLGLLLPGGAAQAAGSETGIASQFKDVGSDNASLVYISYLNARGIISGFPDGSFHPGEGLTRAQAAVIISKAVNLNIAAEGATSFKDVGASHWAARYIATAVQAGYLKGFPDGTYQPEAELTRAQAISLIMRLSPAGDSGVDLPQLSDMEASHWAARAMAMAIDAGMITAQGDSIAPDKAISREDISKALAVLITVDPQLSSRKLTGTLTVKNGEVTLSRGNNTGQSVKNSIQVGAGDTIETGKGSSAAINYPDGSSLLLKDNSILTIKESDGRAYIKKDGKPGTAVDNLVVEMKVGKLFGGLSSLASPVTTADETITTSMKGSKLLAAADSRYDLLAAAEGGETPWYKTAQKQKVKVKVDMPWGVAAIRGSFWQNAVNSDGSGSTSLLEGSAQVTAGGQTVSLSPGEASGGSSAGDPPSAPAPMTPQQAAEWTQVQSWVTETAATMTNNQGAPPAGAPPSDSPGTPAPDPVSALSQALSQAMSQASQTAASAPSATSSSSGSGDSGSGDSSGSGSTSTISVADMPSMVYVPLQSTDYMGCSTNGSGGFSFTVSPSTADVACTPDGSYISSASVYSSGSTRYVKIQSIGSPGTGSLTLTISAAGYTSVSYTVSAKVLPLVDVSPGTTRAANTATVAMAVYGESWNAEESDLTLQIINLDTAQPAVIINSADVIDDGYGGSYISFSLGTSLSPGIYGIVVNKAGAPVGMGLWSVIDSFRLMDVILSYAIDANRGVSDSDCLIFRFNDAIAPSNLGTALQVLSPGGTPVSVYVYQYPEAAFVGLGLGDFSSTFTCSDGAITGLASLSVDRKTLIINLQADAGSITLASGLFTPNPNITNMSGDLLANSTPLRPTSASINNPGWGTSFNPINSITGTAQTNGAVNAVGVGIRRPNDGSGYHYLQADGIWLLNSPYYLPASNTGTGYSTWSLALNSNQQTALLNTSDPVYCDVLLDTGNFASVLRDISVFIADTTAPILSSVDTSWVDDEGLYLIMTFDEGISGVSGKNVYVKQVSDDSTFDTIDAENFAVGTDSSQATILLNPSLGWSYGTDDYYITVEPDAFVDAAGNKFGGTGTDTSRTFTFFAL